MPGTRPSGRLPPQALSAVSTSPLGALNRTLMLPVLPNLSLGQDVDSAQLDTLPGAQVADERVRGEEEDQEGAEGRERCGEQRHDQSLRRHGGLLGAEPLSLLHTRGIRISVSHSPSQPPVSPAVPPLPC